jgi:hypothetical protein
MDRATFREPVLRQSYVFNTGKVLVIQVPATLIVHLYQLQLWMIPSRTGMICESNLWISKISNPEPAKLQED